jgi:hypothetical protein
MAHVANHLQGLLLVEGTRTDVFHLLDGRRITGQDLLLWTNWPWCDSPHAPGGRYVRLMAISATNGRVTLVIVDKPGQERFYLLCRETPLSAPRLIWAWGRRSWIEHHFRTLLAGRSTPKAATAMWFARPRSTSFTASA